MQARFASLFIQVNQRYNQLLKLRNFNLQGFSKTHFHKKLVGNLENKKVIFIFEVTAG